MRDEHRPGPGHRLRKPRDPHRPGDHDRRGRRALRQRAARRRRVHHVTSTERLAGNGFAVVSEELQIEGPIPGDDLVDIRIRAESTDARGLFVGVARSDDVDRYLRDVPVDVVRDVDFDNLDGPDLGVATTPRPGTRAPAPPVAQNFWEASAVGVGAQTLDWSLEAGDWTFVVMRPTGTRGVEADIDLGVGFPSLLWIGVGIMIVGALFLIGGIVLLVLGIRGGEAMAMRRARPRADRRPRHPSRPTRAPAPRQWFRRRIP